MSVVGSQADCLQSFPHSPLNATGKCWLSRATSRSFGFCSSNAVPCTTDSRDGNDSRNSADRVLGDGLEKSTLAVNRRVVGSNPT
jgi:hypothetical protein